MALSIKDRNVLKLILRSPDRSDGWRSVSEACWPLIEEFDEPELLDIDKEQNRVRLSPIGVTVARFVL